MDSSVGNDAQLTDAPASKDVPESAIVEQTPAQKPKTNKPASLLIVPWVNNNSLSTIALQADRMEQGHSKQLDKFWAELDPYSFQKQN
jgi:hypothetical protein